MTASRISPLDNWANGSRAVVAAILPEGVLCLCFHQARSHGGWPSLRLGELVGEPNGTGRVRLGGDQSQRRSACFLKEPLALAQDQGTDDEHVLIDEVLMHERADKIATAQDRYGPTELLLELGHFFGDIALDQSGIVPGRLLQGG